MQSEHIAQWLLPIGPVLALLNRLKNTPMEAMGKPNGHWLISEVDP